MGRIRLCISHYSKNWIKLLNSLEANNISLIDDVHFCTLIEIDIPHEGLLFIIENLICLYLTFQGLSSVPWYTCMSIFSILSMRMASQWIKLNLELIKRSTFSPCTVIQTFTSGIGDLSRLWLSCLGPLVLLLPKL